MLRTIEQGKIWHDSISLWKHELKYYPDEPYSLNNFAASLREGMISLKLKSLSAGSKFDIQRQDI